MFSSPLPCLTQDVKYISLRKRYSCCTFSESSYYETNDVPGILRNGRYRLKSSSATRREVRVAPLLSRELVGQKCYIDSGLTFKQPVSIVSVCMHKEWCMKLLPEEVKKIRVFFQICKSC